MYNYGTLLTGHKKNITNMSSNLEIRRICQYCESDFIARTTVTKYCSLKCSSRAYKARTRNKKIEKSNAETKEVKNRPIEELKAKEFLTVSEVSKLINCSRQNVYKLIRSGKLKATNLLEKKTIIRRKDIDYLFEQPEPMYEPHPIQTVNRYFDFKESYTLKEVQDKYGISESAVQQLIKRNDIPKIKKGWYAYVPQSIIDELLT